MKNQNDFKRRLSFGLAVFSIGFLLSSAAFAQDIPDVIDTDDSVAFSIPEQPADNTDYGMPPADPSYDDSALYGAPPSVTEIADPQIASTETGEGDQYEAASGLALPERVSQPAQTTSYPKSTTRQTSTASKASDVLQLMPSEEIIGRMTDDLFKEMADLEREAALISLQIKRDQLQSDLYQTQMNQRKKVATEIEARERAARERLEWELQMEQRKLELAEKQKLIELKMKQIEEAMIAAENKRVAAAAAAEAGPARGTPGYDSRAEELESSSTSAFASDLKLGDILYRVTEIRGSAGIMFAKIRATDEKNKKTENFFVRKGTLLPSGYEVTAITLDSVHLISPAGAEAVISIPNVGLSLRAGK